MSRRIVIDPVTRVEGHARVTIELGERGEVREARVHVAELRGFEVICVGRPVRELPALVARICGICPVSHAVAAASAGDVLLGAAPPPAARRVRSLAQLGQLVGSHALSFHYLSAPDFAVAPGADPARRSVLGLAEVEAALAQDGVLLRRFGGQVVERVTGQRVHPAFAVPGGVARPVTPEARDAIRAALPVAQAAAARTLRWWKARLPRLAEEAADAELESSFLALVGPGGELDLGGERLRVVAPRGRVVSEGIAPARYAELFEERVDRSTYVKLPRLRGVGEQGGRYRVGPLARLRVATRAGTPRADEELGWLRELAAGPRPSTFHAHAARLVEMVWALERIGELLRHPELLDRDVLSPAGEPAREAVGACEAPRGTLLHHYRADRDGLVTWANLVVATGQNGLAMNAAVRAVAERRLAGARITDELLGRVEQAIRAFDPCLSCATHATGERWVALRIVGPDGEVVDETPGGG